MKVLGIGEVVLDKVCELQCYPDEGTKIQPKRIEASIGGPVASALILLSRLGADCTLIASLGDDEFAQKIKDELRREGILFIPNIVRHTKVNTVLVNSENGSRTIIKDQVDYQGIQNIPDELVEEADLIIFDRHEPAAFDEVMAKKPPETKVVTDPSSEVSEKTIKMMRHSDYPILPIESLKEFGEGKDMASGLQALYKTLGKTVIATAGELGSLIYDGKNMEVLPAASIKTVDTLGAGDIYRGAFAYGLLKNWNLKKCVVFANQVAGLQCTKLGNGTAVPTKQAIAAFCKKAQYKDVSLKDIASACNNKDKKQKKSPVTFLREGLQKTLIAINPLNGQRKDA